MSPARVVALAPDDDFSVRERPGEGDVWFAYCNARLSHAGILESAAGDAIGDCLEVVDRSAGDDTLDQLVEPAIIEDAPFGGRADGEIHLQRRAIRRSCSSTPMSA
jgi:hypothetical protein